MGDVGTINSFELLVVSFKLLLGARTSSSAMSEANSRARLRRVADEDVRAPSIRAPSINLNSSHARCY